MIRALLDGSNTPSQRADVHRQYSMSDEDLPDFAAMGLWAIEGWTSDTSHFQVAAVVHPAVVVVVVVQLAVVEAVAVVVAAGVLPPGGWGTPGSVGIDEEDVVVWIKMNYVTKWIPWPKMHVNGPTDVASST